MASYNKVILVGNLTRDPQMRYLPSQQAVCEFGLAVNHRWKTPDGQQREEVCFVDCDLFGRQAETFNQYMSKGKPVLVEGRLKFDQWEGKDGTKRSKHRVSVDRFVFLGAAGGPGGQAPGAAPRPAQAPANAPAAAAPAPAEEPAYDSAPPAYPDDEQPPAGGDHIPF